MRSRFPYSLFLPLCLVVFSLSALGGCSSNDDDDNDSGGEAPLRNEACDVLGLKIINGTPCSESGSPVVQLTIEFAESANQFLCTGTLIDSRTVLSAAHCFTSAPTLQRVVASVAGQEFQATTLAIHPDYQERDRDAIYDVAVLKLDTAPPATPLPILVNLPIGPGTIISIFGFGLDENGILGRFQSGEMSLDDVTEYHLVSVFRGEGSNTCQGDSGGPALATIQTERGGIPALVGVTSSGTAGLECLEGDRSLFTNLQNQSVLEFITENAPGAALL